ncbi:putative quinol monooxygenase [Flavihumibacter sp. UBA7668]|uniref:putative quinol monooxygenase n=1 Tax=Flavihumibacter sp. UBA7668 TaxID=1946542 RepID=UPI0025B8772E|nr:antibiotic biosynthesis monooxygenase [Flavihumibacter sp. UBA7668]
MLRKSAFKKLRIIGLLVLAFLFFQHAGAQESKQMVRLAKIIVDSTQLKAYSKALNEQMNAAIKLEPGVLTYYAVAEKSAPNQITILEIYADTTAYQSHIKTPHFLKYKDTVKNMVTSLELVDVTLIGVAKKPD